jgi:hypothetical protein
VIQETIRQGVERELFGYGILLIPLPISLRPIPTKGGAFADALNWREIEISQRAVLLRAAR